MMGEEISVFSQRLRDSRVIAGYTQKQLAEELGISSGSVVAYEKSQKIPSVDVCIRLAIFFNVSLDWLCGITDDAKHYEIRTYADAFKMVVALHEWIGVQCFPDPVDGWSIVINDKELDAVFEGWRKIKDLYDSNTIDSEMYQLWVEKQVSRLSKKDVLKYIFASGKMRTEDEIEEKPEAEGPAEIYSEEVP